MTAQSREPARRAVVDHLAAVLELQRPTPDFAVAIGAIARAKTAGYFDMRWIAVDPNLRALHDDKTFLALIAQR
jgi:hypothetical protein